MTTSSAQPTYSTTLDSSYTIDFSSLDTITLTGATGASDTITLDLNSPSTYTTYTAGAATTTIGSLSGGTISIGSISDTISGFTFAGTVEWKDAFPDWNRVQDMCETYPGLKIAFDRFKTIYDIVKDDYDTPPDKRIKP